MPGILKHICTLVLVAISTHIMGQSMRIGVFQGFSFSTATVGLVQGEYQVLADGVFLENVRAPHDLKFVSSSSGLQLVLPSGKKRALHKIELRKTTSTANMRVKPGNASAKTRPYPDNLVVRHRKGKLVLINEVDLEKYVAGVVEAEAGGKRTLEFYKAQAVISRTYALRNRTRHEKEGFHLCDQVHCQVFKGSSRFEPKVAEAALATADLVIVDSEIDLITAAFHANCGGETISSEYVWSKPLPYLVSRKDTFCLTQPSSHWEKRIPTDRWTGYLQKKSAELNLSTTAHDSTWYPEKKTQYLEVDSLAIPLKDIRSDFKLRSCWFSVLEEGDETVLIGRGFGHGVGLCQQGGIRMGEVGWDFRRILHYYYSDVHVIPAAEIPFFRTPGLLEP